MIKLKTKQMHTPYGFTLVIFVKQTNKHKCFFVWQGHFQQFEFLLTPWIDILPISPSGVIQKEFLLKISSTKRWEERKVWSKEKVWFNKKFSDPIVSCKKFTTDCGELIFRYWKRHEIINNYSPRWRCVILSVYFVNFF